MSARLLLLAALVLPGCMRREAPRAIELRGTEELVALLDSATNPSHLTTARDETARLNEAMRAPPSGYAMVVVGVKASESHDAIVVLTDPGKGRILPLFFGGSEGAAIARRLSNESRADLATHDLLDAAIRELGGRVVRAQLDERTHERYRGSVTVVIGERTVSLAAGAADAIAMAVGNAAPLFLAERLFDGEEDGGDVAHAGDHGGSEPLPL